MLEVVSLDVSVGASAEDDELSWPNMAVFRREQKSFMASFELVDVAVLEVDVDEDVVILESSGAVQAPFARIKRMGIVIFVNESMFVFVFLVRSGVTDSILDDKYIMNFLQLI